VSDDTGAEEEREQARGGSGEPPVPDSESAVGDAGAAGEQVTGERDGGAGAGSAEATPGDEAAHGAVQVPEDHETGEIAEDLRAEIVAIMDRYPQRRSASIPVLFAVQRRWGWCDPEGVAQAAAVMGVTPAYLESIASFYDLFHTDPAGSHRVLVCTNISCWMRGADELLDAFCEAAGADRHSAGHGGVLNDAGDVFVSGFECLGACDIAPMASVDERYLGPLETGDAATVIEQLRSGADVMPERAISRRPSAGSPGAS
jgi:NADH:ubiquinone oxidoreductase subunit E